MNYIGKFFTNFRYFYNEINSATLTGAIDVVVIRQDDGSYQCSPFHVRFGKLGVLRSREKIVDIEVNGEPIGIHMKLGESGEAFFVEEVDKEQIPLHLATSPIPSCVDIGSELQKMKMSNGMTSSSDNMLKEPLEQEAESSFSDFLNKTPEVQPQKEKAKTDDQESVVLVSSSPPKKVECVVLQHTEDTKQGSEAPVQKIVSDFVPISNHVGKQKNNHMKKDKSASGESAPEVITIDETSKVRRKRKRKSLNKRRPRSQEIATSTEKIIQSSSEPGEDKIIETTLPHPHLKTLKIPTDGPLCEEEIFQMDEEFGCGVKEQPAGPLSCPVNLPLFPSSLPADPFFLSDPNWRVRKLSAAFAGENFHPFSDGDVTPITSPVGSRPPSPKSDSEYERQSKHDAICQTEEEKISWGWGELPRITPSGQSSFASSQQVNSWNSASLANLPNGQADKQSEVAQGVFTDSYIPGTDGDKPSVLGGMLNFMRPTKRSQPTLENEGIYLDDLNPEELDPEVAAVYFPKYRSTNFQSGNSPSADKDAQKDEDAESGRGPSLTHSPPSVEGAICGLDSDSDERHSVSDFGRQFCDLEMSLCGGLMEYDGEVPPELFNSALISFDDFCENPMMVQSPDLVISMGGKYYNWQTAGPVLLSFALFQRPLPEKSLLKLMNEHMPKKKKKLSWWRWSRQKTTEDELKKEALEISSDVVQSSEPLQDSDSKISDLVVSQPQDIRQMNGDHNGSSGNPCSDDEMLENCHDNLRRQEKYRKTLTLSSEQLAQLNLKDGVNEVEFSVTTAYQGTSRCKCNLYLWNYDDKIIISDIDGTITKSDVLGHILPIIGKDWAQLGVAQLFTRIENNGYQFLYLSARAIGQAKITKDYLKSIRQGDVCLPDGPLLLSPTSLISAFHREVIEKKPEVFKISCLSNIKALFSDEIGNPFYAGFGNKINDTWAYRAVDIPISRIFTINHRGELKLELTQTFQSSYNKLSDVSDHVFPPLQKPSNLRGHLSAAFDVPEHYSSFTYWRVPPPKISGEENLPLLVANKPSTPPTSSTTPGEQEAQPASPSTSTHHSSPTQGNREDNAAILAAG